jgi:hypothetical protein
MEAAQRIAYGHAWRDHGWDLHQMNQDKHAECVHGIITDKTVQSTLLAARAQPGVR